MSVADEVFSSIAEELGVFLIEAAYEATVFQLLCVLAIVVTAAWLLRPTFYPYNEFPRVRRPVVEWPWSKDVGAYLQEGYDNVGYPLRSGEMGR